MNFLSAHLCIPLRLRGKEVVNSITRRGTQSLWDAFG
jgi:hypothetical protein